MIVPIAIKKGIRISVILIFMLELILLSSLLFFPMEPLLKYLALVYFAVLGAAVYRYQQTVLWYEPLEGAIVLRHNAFLIEQGGKELRRFGKRYLFMVRLNDGRRVRVPVGTYDKTGIESIIHNKQ